MPAFWSASSSKRTVMNLVVRAPIAPMVKRRIPLTIRQTAAKSRRFCAKAAPEGAATWGSKAVKGRPYWQNTSMMENLPQ